MTSRIIKVKPNIAITLVLALMVFTMFLMLGISCGTSTAKSASTVSVILDSTSTSPAKTSPIPVTATFSEPVTGFAVEDIKVSNGTAGGFAAVSTTVYTFNVIPATQGEVTVDIDAGVAQDAAGNDNSAANRFSITYDNTAMQFFGWELDTTWEQWAFSGCIMFLFILIAFLSRFIMRGFIRILAHRTKTILDDLIVEALTLPVFLALLVAGLWVSLVRIPDLSDHVDLVQKIAIVLFIAIAALALVRLLKSILIWYGHEITYRTKTDLDDKLLPLIRRVGTILIYIIALLIIIDQMGINISPLLAGLGIGGLAVALALQPTLSNFLAGTYVVSDAVINVGDYITLEGGPEGTVEDIGWRTTKLRHWQGNLIILPNSKLAEAIVTDYEKPDQSLMFAVDCGVSYDSNLERVEQVTIEVAKETMQKYPEGSKDFDPLVRFKSFGDSNINFAVVLKSVDRMSQYVIKNQFIKALHERFKQEGIDIQYPVRKLYFADRHSTWQTTPDQQLADNTDKQQSYKKGGERK